jgi:hypothetical protein
MLLVLMVLSFVLVVFLVIAIVALLETEDDPTDRPIRIAFYVSAFIFCSLGMTLLLMKSGDTNDYYDHLEESEILEQQIDNWDQLGNYERILVTKAVLEFNQVIQDEKELKDNLMTRGFQNELIARMEELELPVGEGGWNDQT